MRRMFTLEQDIFHGVEPDQVAEQQPVRQRGDRLPALSSRYLHHVRSL